MSDPPPTARERLRQLRVLATFTASYLLVASAGAILGGNLEFAFYIGVMLLLVGLVWAVDRRVRLSRGALWALSAWGLLHMAGGLVPVPDGWPVSASGQPVLYSLWLLPGHLKYDHLVHAFGFGATTWVCWEGLRSSMDAPHPTAGPLTLCGAAGMGLGALNEVVEFAATLLVPETNVGGYLNTGWDLVANLVGAVVAVIAIRLTHRD